jgi:hypothetical protein
MEECGVKGEVEVEGPKEGPKEEPKEAPAGPSKRETVVRQFNKLRQCYVDLVRRKDEAIVKLGKPNAEPKAGAEVG